MIANWQSKKLPTVMVWRGPAAVGKDTAAQWLVRASLCQQLSDGPCDVCPACRQVLAGGHPAAVVLRGSATDPITIDHVRQAAKRFLWATVRGESRWWIMTDAEHLTEGATNAILKFFEEPPPDLHIILTSAQADRILPTVISRAAVYYWHTATDQELDQLRPAKMADAAWAQFIARAAGRPGRLHQLINDPPLSPIEVEQRDTFLQALASGQPARLSKLLTPDDITAILLTRELVVRELLLAKMSSPRRRLWPTHPTISEIASRLPLANLLRLADRYLNRYQLLQQHVQPRFILEDLQLV